MLFLLSPAKSLDYDTPLPAGLPHTLPPFIPESTRLIEVLREKSPQDIASLMDLSDTLAGLNVARYAAWSPRFTASNARQALFAFNGDVYEGLQARGLGTEDLQWAQDHVAILSGLYGVLRPLDRMQPYRLEMGTRLATEAGGNLYRFWGPRIAEHLNRRLAADATPVVVNLASQEYFKSVDTGVLKARVIECVFEDWKGDRYKIISFHAKRARGLMARYAIQKRVLTPRQLEGFDLEGYAFAASASAPDRLVFRRKAAP
ncbi:peroxide stress protein YaaA [Acidovorax sp. NCPPB 4044]|uniref:peroxide stress protein YaaA n=1 Tax=Acidovorax sp. NCPPB 4044 TaxID=2940490 RepID=UPI002303CE5A|nr:peroxide stress protein YaaA [Acidovorax sp. NCPPB 4044]MDA8519677.1 peroxide stress protein YaaA [Acidovorax sp. NCPPB 4044]